MPEFDDRILEELIFERVRLVASICELSMCDAALAASIGRALESCTDSPAERAARIER